VVHDALDERVAVLVAAAEDLTDLLPVTAPLKPGGARLPVRVIGGARLEAAQEARRDEVVMRDDVGAQMREISPSERLFGVRASGGDELPCDRPTVAMRREAARVGFRLNDVGTDTAVEIT